MKRYYCTYFDRNYLAKGLALIESLQSHESREFEIFVVCLDEFTRAVLTKLDVPQARLLALHDIEAGDFELMEKKYSRTPVEYYWTLTPTINKWILEKNPGIDVLTYVDADLYFYSDPQPIFDELGHSSVLIHEHRFSASLAHLEPSCGRFNVGLLCFRNNRQAMNVLESWRAQCLEWCFFRFEDNRMGDQMYLNEWPGQFDSITILQHIGAGVAPWNHANYLYDTVDGDVTVSGQPLIFYHFHAFAIASDNVIVPAVHAHYPVVADVLELIVTRYVSTILEIKELLQRVYSEFEFGFNETVEIGTEHALMLRNGSAELDQFNTEHYCLINSSSWTILVPKHLHSAFRPENAIETDVTARCDHPQAGSLAATKNTGNNTAPTQHQPVVSQASNLQSHNKILISALVSTYASEEFMRECLDDLLAQTVAEQIEIIVIDANSPENEKAIVEEYQRLHPNIKYTRTPERIGIYAAWNMAVKQSSGQYLISCSTNDRLHPRACEHLLNALESSPDIGIAYGNSYLTRHPHETFEDNSVFETYTWPEYDFQLLLTRPMVGPHPMWRKSLHYELGYFDESYKAIGDQDFWLRVGEKYKLKRITKYTTLHWITDDSLSGDLSISGDELKRVHLTYENRELYRRWQKGHSIEEIDAQLMAERMEYLWSRKPVITFAMYLGEGQEVLFRNTLSSLENSFYSNWKIKVITALSRPHSLSCQKGSIEWNQVLDEKQFDQAQLDLNKGGLGDWLAFIQPGTEIEPHLLNTLVDYSHIKPQYEFIYFDHDQIDRDGRYQYPQLKPDFNYDYFLAYDYIGPLCMISHAALNAIGGVSFYYQLEHYDMLLKVLASFGEQAIGHIDNILYHAPLSTDQSGTHEMRKQIVSDYLSSIDMVAEVNDGYVPNTCRIDYHHTTTPLVSIIIPTRDKYDYLSQCIDSLLERTRYPAYEVIIVDNESEDVDTLKYMDELSQRDDKSIRVIQYPYEFNYAAISNVAAKEALGDYLLFLNNDTKIIQDNWLDRMMAHAQRGDVGVVGPRLAYPETSEIQHAGVVLGLDGVAGHPYLGTAKISENGYMNRLQVEQNFSAVTGACLLIRKSVYEQVDGMDEKHFAVSYNDIDLCLKVTEAGHRIVWTPYATCLHHGNVSQHERMKVDLETHAKGYQREVQSFIEKWLPAIAHDPAYNRHLSLIDGRYRLETGVIVNWDTNFNDRQKILGLPLYGGSGEYRMRAPLRQIAKAGLAQTECTNPYKVNQQRIVNMPELARTGADTVISHAAIADNAMSALKDYKKYLDVFSIFTLDDLVTHVPDGNNFKRNVPPEPKKRLREALSYCDRLVVTTDPLADFCEDMIEDIVVIPNSLEDELWLPLSSKRNVSKKPRVGWAGAQQHGDDLAFIIDVVKETANEVDWVFFGMCPAEIKDDIAEEHQFLLCFNDYAKKLASLNLDLAIAPLAIHPFNESKSNLRLLEYGIFGWPVICTDIYPYQNAPVKRVQNRKDAWLEAIRERIHDLDAAYQEGDTLREWVLDNYLLSQHLDTWSRAVNIQPQVKIAGNLKTGSK